MPCGGRRAFHERNALWSRTGRDSSPLSLSASVARGIWFCPGTGVMYPWPARLRRVKPRFTRLRSAGHSFRSSSLLAMPVRLALFGNGYGPCGAAVWSAPPSCRIAMRRSRRSMLATSAPPAVKDGYFQHYSGTEPFRLERFVIENICGPEHGVPARRFHAAGAVRRT